MDIALSDTIETYWHGIKGEKRPGWIKELCSICDEKKWNLQQLQSALQSFCRKYSTKKGEDDKGFAPRLSAVIKYLDSHIVGQDYESDEMAVWRRLPSCEKCYNGFVGYIDWSYYEPPKKVYNCFSAFCDCPKGQNSPFKAEPMKRMSYQELLDKIAAGSKYTIVPREDMIPVKDQTTLPGHDDVVKSVEEAYNTMVGIPF
jgi:hypothetical protein